jgi:hypothetical protein
MASRTATRNLPGMADEDRIAVRAIDAKAGRLRGAVAGKTRTLQS